jgi:hypothetical protein
MIERDELDDLILENARALVGHTDWVSADVMQRLVRADLGYSPADRDQPSLMWVARRMSALAKAGRLERQAGNGNWLYRMGSAQRAL